jgi:hypothetical protein
MLPAVHLTTAPLVTAAHLPSPSPDLSPSPLGLATSSLPSLIDSDVSHIPHPFVIDDDARSDTSMPPLYDASDSESGEEPFHHNVYDFTSDSEVDAHDVEMTLFLDDGNLSDSDGATYLDDVVLPPSDTMTTVDGNMNHHVMVEEDQHMPHADAVPPPRSPSGPQPGTSSHLDPHSRVHAHVHAHAHPHPHPHLPPPPHPHPHQHLHLPHPPHLHAGVQLPTFPGMPGLRAQGQGDGQVPLPGLRTLFQPFFVEGVAEAGERLRTAQATGNPGQAPGPTVGPDPLPAGANRAGVPVVQVTFNVPVFRLPTDARPRQQQQTDAQRPAEQVGEHERAFAAAPLGADNTNADNNQIPDGLRQFIEALEFNPNPNPDGPQVGPPPALTGLLGLLFGLGLGSPELYREDPARAKRLINGLETVNAGLVKRMRKIGEGSADGAICAICWDTLLEESAEPAEVPVWDAVPDREPAADSEPGPSSPATPEEPLPKVVALPCSHVFHSGCLVPWFSRPKQTTCPTCRFNVDPDNLTYEPPRRPQADPRQPPPPQQPNAPQPAAPAPASAPEQPTQQQQQQQELPFGPVPPPQQGPQQPVPPPLRRTIFEHTFTIPFPPPQFPFPNPQPGNQGPQPGFPQTIDPFSPQAFQRTLHTLRQFAPAMQHRTPPPPPDGAPAPAQEGAAPPPIPPQPQVRPPMPGQRQGLQPPPQDANANGTPRFPGLFQFELPQVVHMPDDTWFLAAPLGDFTPPMNAARPPNPPTPREWAPPPPPGLTLRQRVEQGEREQGLRCDDMSCGLGPSDDDPEPMADLARVIIHALGDGNPACAHAFHPACLVSAERVAGWVPDDEREHTGSPVEVSCPVCRANGAIAHEDWNKGVQALV